MLSYLKDRKQIHDNHDFNSAFYVDGCYWPPLTTSGGVATGRALK